MLGAVLSLGDNPTNQPTMQLTEKLVGAQPRHPHFHQSCVQVSLQYEAALSMNHAGPVQHHYGYNWRL
jgi:hypothetical protein